jgi:hypothetical protein
MGDMQCSTTAEIDAEAKAIINEAAWLPANCAEIDSGGQAGAEPVGWAGAALGLGWGCHRCLTV